MTRKELIDALNGDLEMEYRSIVQYVQHIGSVKGAKYQQTVNELASHVNQELEHAKTLACQIDFLGGVPSNAVQPFETLTEPRAALTQDLELEELQLQRYRERTEQANALGLPDVAEALAPLMEQTQEHVRDLRSAIER